VIGAGNLNGHHHALKAEFFDARHVKIEVLKTPADLLSGQGLFAEFLLGVADTFDSEHGSNESYIVEGLSDLISLPRSFSLGVDIPLNIGMHWEFAGAGLESVRDLYPVASLPAGLTSVSEPDHQTPIILSRGYPTAAACLMAALFIAPQPQSST